MKNNKTSFSFLDFFKRGVKKLSQLINRFFAWMSRPFKSEKKTKLQSQKIRIVDLQGEIVLTCDNDANISDVLTQYLKIRNISSTTDGELVCPDEDKQQLSRETTKLYYVPKNHLLLSICKPGEERDSIQRDNLQIVSTQMPASELLSQYEKQHQIPANEPGKLLALGQTLSPNQTLKSIDINPYSLTSITYIAYKPSYTPRKYQLSIPHLSGDSVKIERLECESTDTLNEALARFHTLTGKPAIPSEQIEVLTFLDKDFKGQQTVDEVYQWGLLEWPKRNTPPTERLLTMKYNLRPAPVVIRIGTNREAYRIECDTNETVPSILKKFHEARHTSYEEGSLKTFHYDLDNTKTLAEQNIKAGTLVEVTYKPQKRS